jgi:hypothetical protein
MAKFAYSLTLSGVTVSLEAETGESFAAIQYDGGSKNEIALITYDLERSCGMFGNQIGTVTTPNDLAVAMASPEMQVYRPELIEGAELLGNAPANPQPDGSMF